MSREMGMAREIPFVEGVEHRQVLANGIRIHLAEAGDPDAPPVICLHGWPQHWYLWRHLIGPLAESRRVICPDLRGLGWSEAPPGGYHKERLADDLLALVDVLEVERASLVGHDWGGWVGFLACLREPERFEAFLALAISPPFSKPTPRSLAAAWRLAYQLPLASPWGDRVAAGLAGAARRPGLRRRFQFEHWDTTARDSFLGQFSEPERARASVGYYRSFLMRELPALAGGRYRDARLQVPTRLLLGSEEAVMTPAMLEVEAGSADDYEFEVVPGAGHFIVDQRPELVLERARALFGLPSSSPKLLSDPI
ncbi:MAG TPA: alpha/beta fold hydrolase [Solirubrobacterales bacterium]